MRFWSWLKNKKNRFWSEGSAAYRSGQSTESCPYSDNYGKNKGESRNAREKWMAGFYDL